MLVQVTFTMLILWVVEAVALIVQIHLQQNRTDLALKEVLAAKKWAQDNLLIKIGRASCRKGVDQV